MICKYMKNTLPEISLISFEIIRYDIAIQSHVSINVILNSNDSTIPFLSKRRNLRVSRSNRFIFERVVDKIVAVQFARFYKLRANARWRTARASPCLYSLLILERYYEYRAPPFTRNLNALR